MQTDIGAYRPTNRESNAEKKRHMRWKLCFLPKTARRSQESGSRAGRLAIGSTLEGAYSE